MSVRTNLKNSGNTPNAPRTAGGKPNGGGQMIQEVRGTAMGNQEVK